MKKLLLLLMLLMCSTALWATVPNAPFSVTYTCTGSAGPFAFTFPVADATAITVTENGALVLPANYTIVPVNNNYNNGGSITLTSACTAGWLLVITRVTPVTQTISFYDNMPIPMKTFERGLDKLTEIAQELKAIGGGGGGGVLPCGAPGDIQLFLDSTNFGCDTGAATIDPINHTLSIGVPGGDGKIIATKEIDVIGTGAGEIDLGVDGTSAGILQLSNGSAAFHTILATGATANYTFKFPPTAGTATWLLKTDGSGNTDWVAPGSGGVGTVTSIATTAPITGGTITTTGTIGCATCVTSAASLTDKALVVGSGGAQGTAVAGNFTYNTNTLSMGASGILDLSAGVAGAFKVPSYAGGATTGDGQFAFNTTAKSYHIYQNSGDAIVASFKTTPTNGQCASWVTDGTSFVLGSQACSALAVSGSSGDIQMNSGSSTLAAAHINDDGTDIHITEPISLVLGTAGAGGVTQNLLAAVDGSNPSKYVLPVAGNCGAGFALDTATAGNTFHLGNAVEDTYTGVADNSITAGHIVIGGTSTPGRVKDSGGTQITGVSVGTCVVGKALANATVGNTVPVMYLGLGTFGTSGTATYTGSPAAGRFPVYTATAGQTQNSNTADFSAAPTTGHLVSCTTAGGVCTLTDGGAPPSGGVTSVSATGPEDALHVVVTNPTTTPAIAITKQNENFEYAALGPSTGAALTPFIVQSKNCAIASGNPWTCSFDGPTQAGNLVYVSFYECGTCSGATGSSNKTGTVVDGTNTYTLIDLGGPATWSAHYYAKNVAAGAQNIVITDTGSINSPIAITITEIANLDTSAPLDKHNFQDSSCDLNAAAQATSNANDLIFQSCFFMNNGSLTTLSAGIPFVLAAPALVSTTPLVAMADDYLNVNATGTYYSIFVKNNDAGAREAYWVALKAATTGANNQWSFRPITLSTLENQAFPGLFGRIASVTTGDTQISLHVGQHIISSDRTTAYAGNDAASTLYTTTTASGLRCSLYVKCNTAVNTATVIPNLIFTSDDGSSTVETIVGPTATCTTLGTSDLAFILQPIHVKAATTVYMSTTLANSPHYNTDAFCELTTTQ